jgi:transcriptional regulator with XRE-family HTH domain
MDQVENLGARLRERRVELRLTQAELALLVDVTPNTISMTERGHSIPSLKMLLRLADALEVEPAELLPGSGGPKKVRTSVQPL